MPLVEKPSRLEFDVLDEDLIDAVAQAFGAGPVLAADTLILEGSQLTLLSERSETSRKFLLTTAQGRFFLKQVPWYCDDPAHLAFSHKLVIRLAVAGLPATRFLTTPAGETWTQIGDARFTLLEYRSGAPYRGLTAEVEAAARVLARMHRAAAGCPVASADPHESLDAIVRSHIELAGQQPFCTPAARRVLDRLAEYTAARLVPPAGLPALPVHGDFIPWNLAFAGGEVAAIYDFDNSCVDARLHDVGEAVVAFFALDYVGRSSRLQPGLRTAIAPDAAAFLAAYHEEYPLTAAERDWLPAYVLGAWWECALLSFIRGEQRTEHLPVLLDLPAAVAAWQGASAAPP